MNKHLQTPKIFYKKETLFALAKIRNYFGESAQKMQLIEELGELREAIDDLSKIIEENTHLRLDQTIGYQKFNEHVIEEIADVLVVANQFFPSSVWLSAMKELETMIFSKINKGSPLTFYDFTYVEDEVVLVIEDKIQRTLSRIESGYYQERKESYAEYR